MDRSATCMMGCLVCGGGCCWGYWEGHDLLYAAALFAVRLSLLCLGRSILRVPPVHTPLPPSISPSPPPNNETRMTSVGFLSLLNQLWYVMHPCAHDRGLERRPLTLRGLLHVCFWFLTPTPWVRHLDRSRIRRPRPDRPCARCGGSTCTAPSGRGAATSGTSAGMHIRSVLPTPADPGACAVIGVTARRDRRRPTLLYAAGSRMGVPDICTAASRPSRLAGWLASPLMPVSPRDPGLASWFPDLAIVQTDMSMSRVRAMSRVSRVLLLLPPFPARPRKRAFPLSFAAAPRPTPPFLFVLLSSFSAFFRGRFWS